MILSIDSDLITVDRIQFGAAQTIDTNMLRLDKIHPQISGNKWFKLKYQLELAHTQKKHGLVTLGGPWSNHLHAVAAAAASLNWPSIGVIRGEKPLVPSQTLTDVEELGMHLEYISRNAYQNRQTLLQQLQQKYPDYLVLDEGGRGLTGIQGAAEILKLVANLDQYTHILAAVGTGTTLAGLCLSALPSQFVIGISSLKGKDTITGELKTWLPESRQSFQILTPYHFGGYARHQPELLRFMSEFFEKTRIPTDFVYTGKLCYAWNSLCEASFFPPGSSVLLIHSGGLQGNRSLPAGKLIY